MLLALAIVLGAILALAGLSLLLLWWRWAAAGRLLPRTAWRVLGIPLIAVGIIIPLLTLLLTRWAEERSASSRGGDGNQRSSRLVEELLF